MSALSGLAIADFSRILAGPLATMVLADLGAEVIKIERPGGGDDTRSWGPPYDAEGTATYFLSVNRNKRSETIDLGTDAGRDRARVLAIESGIVVENFRPGVMNRLGLGYEELKRHRPDVIYCSISAFGAGAGADLPGFDIIVQAVGGLMSITGDSDGEPQKVGVAVVDVIAGLYASIGILAAVRHRERTGEGQKVEVNLLSTVLSALVNQGAAYVAAGVTPARQGTRHPSIAPYETLPTMDGQLAVAVGNEKQFAALCAVLEIPELAANSLFASNSLRVRNRGALRAALDKSLSNNTSAYWAARLSGAGVPAGPVNDIAAAFALAESLGLKPTVNVEGIATVRNPIGLSATPVTYRLRPPLPSE
ncbi:MAG: CoA transferase [Actinomycetota bacterium]|nr:CoA transferase [Actinomycetota bacterium]